MNLTLTGIHHLTAVTAQASLNLAFYSRTVGMRLVKKTVNQDDVSAYHLFYADGAASPGSDLTFFDWADLPRANRGGRSVTRTGLRVDSAESLDWWAARFVALGVHHGEVVERFGRPTLDFEDPEGQRLSLVAEPPLAPIHPWTRGPVPVAHQIRGLGPVTMTTPQLALTAPLLTDVMGMRPAGVYPDPHHPRNSVHVFVMAGQGAAAELHVAVRPDLPPARLGAGAVHHVAFRVSTFEQQQAWERHLSAQGVRHSGVIERYYFSSIYFREPGGVLFELATDGPGFAVDEPLETLGERLSLPPFLEPHRAQIETHLTPLA